MFLKKWICNENWIKFQSNGQFPFENNFKRAILNEPGTQTTNWLFDLRYAAIDEFSWEHLIHCYLTNVKEQWYCQSEELIWKFPWCKPQTVEFRRYKSREEPSDAIDLESPWCRHSVNTWLTSSAAEVGTDVRCGLSFRLAFTLPSIGCNYPFLAYYWMLKYFILFAWLSMAWKRDFLKLAPCLGKALHAVKSFFIKTTSTTMNRTVHNISKGFLDLKCGPGKITAVCKS